VPTSLRYHGDGGYVALPPYSTGTGELRWVREPVVEPGEYAPWLPRIGTLVDALVRAGRTAPTGTG